jgi:hypothetical protein
MICYVFLVISFSSVYCCGCNVYVFWMFLVSSAVMADHATPSIRKSWH